MRTPPDSTSGSTSCSPSAATSSTPRWWKPSSSRPSTANGSDRSSPTSRSSAPSGHPGGALGITMSTRRRHWLIAGAVSLLLVVMAVTMLTVIARKSITIDEIVMIPSAYYHLHGNFDLVHEHPPLVKFLAGLPLLSLGLARVQPEHIPDPPATPGHRWAHYAHFWEGNRPLFDAISFRARLGPIALTIALGGLLFAFGRRLFGARAALIALALFSLEPTVLAHGRVVQTDVPAAFGFVLLFYAVHVYLARPHAAQAAGLGLAGAIAILGKFSMLL